MEAVEAEGLFFPEGESYAVGNKTLILIGYKER
jgi:hypothetical protein